MLAAGAGVENGTEHVSGYLAFRKDWLRKIGVSPANAVLARTAGDSMQPVIWDGDLLLIDRSKTEPPTIPRPDRPGRFAPVFALLDDGLAKVKRLQMLDRDTAVLISDNPDYPPLFSRINTLAIIGKVMWWGHTSRE
jgi:phage repressor protein C with HTH and peptisase S24 domain